MATILSGCTAKRIVVATFFLLLILSYHEVAAQLFRKNFRVNGRTIRITELNRQIRGIVDSASIPGLSFAVVNKNKVVFYNTYGYKKYQKQQDSGAIGTGKVNKKTIFEACSLSKNFFVFAVMRLVDQGVLNLDTPLYQYLEYSKLAQDDRYRKITGRMVLSHSSGVENWQSENDPARLEIMHDPGTAFLYSGEGYVYLSLVVEKLLGKSTRRYMNELVFKPLRLKRTFSTFLRDGQGPRNYSIGHNSFLDRAPKGENEQPNIAAYIHTTARSYAKLLIGTFSSHFLSKDRLDDLTGSGTRSDYHYPAIMADNHWGPGYAVSYEKGDTVLYQAGNNGEFKGFGFYSVTKKMGYALFVNGQHGDQIINILDSLTTGGRNIFQRGHNVFDNERGNQYPSLTFNVLNIYNTKGSSNAVTYFKMVASNQNNPVSKSDLGECGELFLEKEPDLAMYIAEEYMRRYPFAKEAYILHGKAIMKRQRFEEAINDFEKALALDGSLHEQLHQLISHCNDQAKKTRK